MTKTSADDTASRVAFAFASDIGDHQTEVLLDQGLYRHVKFASPFTRLHWFDLITTPGTLTVRGDMGTYVFARADDMFTFFETTPVGQINAPYWAEKLIAEDTFASPGNATRVYSPGVAKELVENAVEEYLDSADLSSSEGHELRETVDTEVLPWADDERELRSVLDDFQRGEFDFYDSYEWDMTEFSYRFLWCLHAIRWGINDYREAQETLHKYGPGKDTA